MNPLIVVHDNYSPLPHRAYHAMRLGPFHGFKAIGLQPQFIRHSDIVKTEVEDPVYLLTWDDYNYLSDQALELIRDCLHIVMVNPWFDGIELLPTRYNAPNPLTSPETLKRIIENEPTFVWGLDPEPYLMFYEKWKRMGCKVVSLPPACDTTRHYPSGGQGFNVDVGFVGSHRAYKTTQYENYLWPYEDRLGIWDHNEWPKCYRGEIGYSELKILYQNAKVCPTISEPVFSFLWALPERPFAVLGSGGLTVLDCVPSYKYLFSSDEVLMPDTINEYHQMMDVALHDEDFNQEYRVSGFTAVMERHTCVHRVKKIIQELKE